MVEKSFLPPLYAGGAERLHYPEGDGSQKNLASHFQERAGQAEADTAGALPTTSAARGT